MHGLDVWAQKVPLRVPLAAQLPVEVQVLEPMSRRERARVGALAGARVAEHEDLHAA